ncbi:MAG: hypothetical protein MJK08_07050 [Campylobacterales bacterium]|nr:hypothetical protein [Campylobacterales bacterium]
MLKINSKDIIDVAKEGAYLLNIAQNPFDEHEKYESYSRVTPLKYENIKFYCSS